MYADRHQYLGERISTSVSSCPEPFGSDSDKRFCNAWCTNTCPELHPDPVAGVQQQIDHLNAQIPYIQSAMTDATAAAANLLTHIEVIGSVIFTLPPYASSEVAALVLTFAQTKLTNPEFKIKFNVRMCVPDVEPAIRLFGVIERSHIA
jgi:hypothetical protein